MLSLWESVQGRVQGRVQELVAVVVVAAVQGPEREQVDASAGLGRIPAVALRFRQKR